MGIFDRFTQWLNRGERSEEQDDSLPDLVMLPPGDDRPEAEPIDLFPLAPRSAPSSVHSSVPSSAFSSADTPPLPLVDGRARGGGYSGADSGSPAGSPSNGVADASASCLPDAPSSALAATERIRHVPAVLAIDLGTSASTVASTFAPNQPPACVNFAHLGQRERERVHLTPFIDSDVYIGPMSKFSDDILEQFAGQQCVLGNLARPLTGRSGALQLDRGLGQFFTSVKRMLDTCGAQSGVQITLAGVFRELLLLALYPEESATLYAHYLLSGEGRGQAAGAASSAPPAPPGRDALQFYARGLELGFRPQEREKLLSQMRLGGLNLFITVPNSYSKHEIDILVQAAEGAAMEIEQRSGMSGRTVVSPLREAEAVAWWQHHCLQDEIAEAGERWLVFDMGAGTTDVSLLEVDPYSAQLQCRAGVPIGGDDVDLLILAQLADKATRDYFLEHPEGPDLKASFDSTTSSLLGHWTRAKRPQRGAAFVEDVWNGAADPGFFESFDNEARIELKRLAQECKLVWSQAIRGLKGYDCGPLLEHIFSNRSRPLEPADVSDKGQYIIRSEAYRLFVNLVTRGCCVDLLEQMGGAVSVDRVIISGRASRLPIVAEALHEVLAELDCLLASTEFSWPRVGRSSAASSLPSDGKLAVVRGAAVYASRGWVSQAPARVSGAVVMEMQQDARPLTLTLFREGSPLDGLGQSRKTVGLTPSATSRQPQFRVDIFRQRVPLSIVDELCRSGSGSRYVEHLPTSMMVRKLLSEFILVNEAQLLGLCLDEGKGELSVYVDDGGGGLRRSPLEGAPKQMVGIHPVTGLPEDWLWSETGSLSSGIG